MTVVDRSRWLLRPATCGAKPSSPNASTLSLSVRPNSDPATSAMYTDFGIRRFARRCASATVSNHSLPILHSAFRCSCRRLELGHWQAGQDRERVLVARLGRDNSRVVGAGSRHAAAAALE